MGTTGNRRYCDQSSRDASPRGACFKRVAVSFVILYLLIDMHSSLSAALIAPTPVPPLDSLSRLPDTAAGLAEWRILLLVTSVNSFTQRVLVYLKSLGIEQVSTQLATSDEDMLMAAEAWRPQIILCPFLTRRIPESVFARVSFVSRGEAE